MCFGFCKFTNMLIVLPHYLFLNFMKLSLVFFFKVAKRRGTKIFMQASILSSLCRVTLNVGKELSKGFMD